MFSICNSATLVNFKVLFNLIISSSFWVSSFYNSWINFLYYIRAWALWIKNYVFYFQLQICVRGLDFLEKPIEFIDFLFQLAQFSLQFYVFFERFLKSEFKLAHRLLQSFVFPRLIRFILNSMEIIFCVIGSRPLLVVLSRNPFMEPIGNVRVYQLFYKKSTFLFT